MSKQNTLGIYSGPDPKSPEMVKSGLVDSASLDYSVLPAVVPSAGDPLSHLLKESDHNPQSVVSGRISAGCKTAEIMNGCD